MLFSLHHVKTLVRSWLLPPKQATIRRRRSGLKLLLEALEERLVPANTPKGIISLNLGNGSTAIAASPSQIVPVFIDFDNNSTPGTNAGPVGGVSGGSFYLTYDPKVLSISESATSVGSDVKLGSLISALPLNYNLSSVAGFAPGVVAIGLNHTGANYAGPGLTGHLIELDFHVVQTTSIANSTLLDLQEIYTDANLNTYVMNIHDKNNSTYNLIIAPSPYTGTLTQAGALNPATFSPSDTDTTDVAIQILAGNSSVAPVARTDSYSMAPNTASFTTTMTETGLANGVLGNDTATANGPMDALLTGAGVSSIVLGPVIAGISSASETGNVVTITTSASATFSAGEYADIAGIATNGYNGRFAIANVLSGTQFTYTESTTNLPADSSGGTATSVATTVYTQNTNHGTVWLNGIDGSFSYTPNANYLGTDTFTYKAVDAVSTAASVDTTVTITVGGYVSIPQTLTTSGGQVVAPVNISSGNPANSGGLSSATIGINYDASKFSVANVSKGTLIPNIFGGNNWSFSANTSVAGKIVITTSASGGGSLPLNSAAGGSLALITFNVISSPPGTTSVLNISNVSPASTELDVAGTGTGGGSLILPFAIAPADNVNFNGLPGPTDGLVRFPTNTTTTVAASVSGSPVSTVIYGTPVTLTATVSPNPVTGVPSLGSVDFKDGGIDLGVVASETPQGNNAVFTLVTSVNQLQVIQTSGGAHTITATYSPGTYFNGSTGTLAGGLTVTAAPLTITASFNAKTYDATTTAAIAPTVAGLLGTDSISNLAEVYVGTNAGSSKILSVSSYTINDNNSGKDYIVTTVTNTAGVINKAPLTVTATANVKTYDSFVTASALATVAGLFGSDSVSGRTEVYSSASAGSNKILSVSAYTVNDTNGGNNYTVTTAINAAGIINKAALTISAIANTKTYDSMTTAAAQPSVTGLVGTDSVSGQTEVYSDANFGTGKTLSVSAYTVNDGVGGNNYAVTTVVSAAGSITRAIVTISATPNTKTYDATTSSAALPTVTGLIGGDTISGQAETYFNANVGANKSLSVSNYTITNANNYSVVLNTTTGAITAAPLTITASTTTKTYDSTTTAAAVPTVSGLVGNDSVSGTVEVFNNSSTGTGKAISVIAYTVNDGNSGNNYAVTTFANNTGAITKAPLTITATTNTKTYDSTTSAAAAIPTVSGLIGGDSATNLAEVFTDKNAGSSKTLSVSSFNILDGNGGNNYSVSTFANITGVITQAALTVTALKNTKTYDSTTTAAAAPSVSGLLGLDSVTGQVEVYSDKNAGSSKTLSVSAYTINDGMGGNNYSVTTVINTAGPISKAPLTITARPNTKTFDGTTSSITTPTFSGLLGSDSALSSVEVYSDATVGTGKTLSVSAFSISDGNSGNNYNVTTTPNLTGVINPAAGKSLVSLDVGAGMTSVTASPTGTVSVFIDFDNHMAAGTSTGSNGGVAGGSFYVLYDPSVLSISETACGVGSDIKLGTLLSGSPANSYKLATAAGFSTGVVAIGLNHNSSSPLCGVGLAGHLLELDFHVVQTAALDISSLLDLQSHFVDAGNSGHNTNIHDKGNLSYALTPVPTQYAALRTASTLTQAGALTPRQFSPADTDTPMHRFRSWRGVRVGADGAVGQLQHGAEHGRFHHDDDGRRPGQWRFGQRHGHGEWPDERGVDGRRDGSAAVGRKAECEHGEGDGQRGDDHDGGGGDLVAGEGVTIAGVGSGYNGNYAVASVLSSTQFTYTALTNMPDASAGTVSPAATTVLTGNTANGRCG